MRKMDPYSAVYKSSDRNNVLNTLKFANCKIKNPPFAEQKHVINFVTIFKSEILIEMMETALICEGCRVDQF